MYQADWKMGSKLRYEERQIKAKVLINSIEYIEEIISMKFDDSINTGESFTIGEVYSKRCEIVMKEISGVLENSVVKPYLAVEIGGSLTYVPMGVFTATEINGKKGVTTLVCYDYMMKLEDEYISNLTFPATTTQIINEICTTKNITFSGTIAAIAIPKKPLGYSYREVVGYIASLNGGNAKFDRHGNLIVKKYEYVKEYESGTIVGLQTITSTKTPVSIGGEVYSISGRNYMSLDLKAAYKVSGVACKFGDFANNRGDETYNTVAFVNPLVDDTNLDGVYNTLKDIEFVACDVKYRGNFLLDAGDIITICDTQNKEYNILISSHTLNFAGGLNGEIRSIGEGKNANEFKQNKFKNGKSVTELNIRLGEIEGKVTETTTNLEDMSERINAAELKITPEAITNTVSKTYTTKTDFDNNNTDIANTYSTKSELVQTSEKITFKFSSSGGYNLIKNSNFDKGMDYFWGHPALPHRHQNYRAIYTEPGQRWGLYQTIECKPNTTYTASALFGVENNCGEAYVVIELPQESYRAIQGEYIKAGTSGTSIATITTGNSTQMNVYISVLSSNNIGQFVTWFADYCCYEGELKLPWSPHPQEIYGGNTNIDINGVEITNGSLKVTNANSQVVIDGQYNIHKIITTGIIECIMKVGETDKTFVITHNLGYHPHTSCSQMMDGAGWGVPLPAFSVSQVSSTVLGYEQIIRARTTINTLEINVVRSQNYAQTERNMKVRYFIYKEVAF